jgi:hypothetical protein
MTVAFRYGQKLAGFEDASIPYYVGDTLASLVGTVVPKAVSKWRGEPEGVQDERARAGGDAGSHAYTAGGAAYLAKSLHDVSTKDLFDYKLSDLPEDSIADILNNPAAHRSALMKTDLGKTFGTAALAAAAVRSGILSGAYGLGSVSKDWRPIDENDPRDAEDIERWDNRPLLQRLFGFGETPEYNDPEFENRMDPGHVAKARPWANRAALATFAAYPLYRYRNAIGHGLKSVLNEVLLKRHNDQLLDSFKLPTSTTMRL